MEAQSTYEIWVREYHRLRDHLRTNWKITITR